MTPLEKTSYKDLNKRLKDDPAFAKSFWRRVMGPPCVSLEGEDKTQMMLILSLLEPFRSTNNQVTWTDYYRHNDKVYSVTTFNTDNYCIDEYEATEFDFEDADNVG